jgi:hypothetical protein
MNIEANNLLSKAKKQIDILAIGMSNYLADQRQELEDRFKSGVVIRILSCDPDSEMLTKREADESLDGSSPSLGKMKSEIIDLTKWVASLKSKCPERKDFISIRYINSYPAFAYQRIDSHCFWGPNLYFKPSQQSIAWSFKEPGNGFSYFSNYFDKLWTNKQFSLDMYESILRSTQHTPTKDSIPPPPTE